MLNFLPHNDTERQTMLNSMGLSSQSDLFEDIPQSLRGNIHYHSLPKTGVSELEIQQQLKALSQENQGAGYRSFLGGGAYPRFIPMAVNTIASRSEFYTAYTPYQPEMSQGTLQVGYEFQTMIAELTGLDVANASVYDGGTAVSEAAFMAVRITKRKHILVGRSVHPQYRGILQTYVTGLGDVRVTEFNTLDNQALETLQNPQDVACIILQQPDYFGSLADMAPWQAFCQAHGALLIVSSDPTALGLLMAPGQYGADIVVGDIQPLGNHLSFGGPYGGFMATRQKHMRQLPGRLVGRTKDKHGRPCYSLTLQTREQHIRREKATSNICTNQALNVLKATVYLSLVGPQGLKHVANLSMQRAHELATRLSAIDGIKRLHPEQPFFSEFAIQLPIPVETVLAALAQQKILGGIPLATDYPEYPNSLLISTTEMTTAEDVAEYAQIMLNLIQQGEKKMLANPKTASPKSPSQELPTAPRSLEACPS